MRRPPAARFAAGCALALIVLLALLAGCAPATSVSPGPSGGASPAPSREPAAVASLNPCASPIAHLTAFANRLSGQIAELRPLVTDPEFDSSATAAGIRGISGTLTDYLGLEGRLAGCPATAPIADRIAALRADAKASIDVSTHASIRDQITQRAVAAALFGLLPDVQDIATATAQAALSVGIDTQVAVVPDGSAAPIGSLPPLATPTPRPTRPPTDDGAYGTAFFGPNAVVETYRISGRTPLDLVASIEAHGPRNDWLHGRAEALTVALPHVQVGVEGAGGSCHVVTTGKPAVFFSFTITLPRWDPPSDASSATVIWWNAELKRAAVHENHHVELWRAAGEQMARAVPGSTCSTLQSRLASIAKATTRANCEFDMAEYGEAIGLSLDECLAG